jgi:RNA polymerase sigma factor (sigma-70 family)
MAIPTSSPSLRFPSAIDAMLTAAAHTELLTERSEHELFVRYSQGDSAASEQIIEHFLPLVVGVARPFARAGVDLGELMHEGCLGLMEAMQRFELQRGVRFSTYARWWVRKFVITHFNAYAEVSGAQLDPHHLSADEEPQDGDNELELNSEIDTRVQDSESKPSDGPSGRAASTHQTGFRRVDLDAVPEGLMATEAHTEPAAQAEKRQELAHVALAVKKLPERLRIVIEMRFGLIGGEEATLADVAARLGISIEGARKLQLQAIAALRTTMKQTKAAA